MVQAEAVNDLNVETVDINLGQHKSSETGAFNFHIFFYSNKKDDKSQFAYQK